MPRSFRSPIAAVLVLTMFSTVFGQSWDCTASCQAAGCMTVTTAKACCGGCGTGNGCQCKKSAGPTAKKSCCDKSKTTLAASCCAPKSAANDSPSKTTCNADCPCAHSAEFPPLPLEQQSNIADSLKLPIIACSPMLAVFPAPTDFTLGQISPDDSPPPRAGHGLRIWICSWTT